VKKEKKREKGNKEKGNEKKEKNRKGQFRHFTTSIQQVKSFCQTFSKMASAHYKSRSNEGAGVGAGSGGAEALPNRPYSYS
jgi:hypothetical protein